jgi:hypothetical protein
MVFMGLRNGGILWRNDFVSGYLDEVAPLSCGISCRDDDMAYDTIRTLPFHNTITI